MSPQLIYPLGKSPLHSTPSLVDLHCGCFYKGREFIADDGCTLHGIAVPKPEDAGDRRHPSNTKGQPDHGDPPENHHP